MTKLNLEHKENVYVIGDLHGAYDKLLCKLDEINFNKETDVVISVGDLIDRGKQSINCLELLYENWFYAVKGNHEDMMCRSIIDDDLLYQRDWLYNGGYWYLNNIDTDVTAYIDILAQEANKLPLYLEITYKGKIVLISHAQWYSSQYNADPVKKLTAMQENTLIWGRESVQRADKGEEVTIIGADLCIHGHTPTPEGVKSGNCMWIDTGATFEEGFLTCINLKEEIIKI